MPCLLLPQRSNSATTGEGGHGCTTPSEAKRASTQPKHHREAQARNALASQANVQLTKGDLLARSGPHKIAITTYAGADDKQNEVDGPYLAPEDLLRRSNPAL